MPRDFNCLPFRWKNEGEAPHKVIMPQFAREIAFDTTVLTLSGLQAFQKVLELTRPVDESRELWLKLGHNEFIFLPEEDPRFSGGMNSG